MHSHIGKPNHTKPERVQCFRPPLIFALISAVGFSINLYNQLELGTVEVSDVPIDPDLPSEFEAVQSPISEAIPKLLFRRRRLPPHAAREFH
jgi:hypothetical protein